MKHKEYYKILLRWDFKRSYTGTIYKRFCKYHWIDFSPIFKYKIKNVSSPRKGELDQH